jgi:cellobionic acid phosphorylase
MNLVELHPDAIILRSPTDLPQAGGYLWNSKMLFQINCQGYASAQFLQPEPASYATGPVLQATTFMQPEQPVYAHHPGRFFYIKDEHDGKLCSIPYAPVKSAPSSFEFKVTDQHIEWRIEDSAIRYVLRVHLDKKRVIEHWQLSIENLAEQTKKLSLYPYFPIGYHSWMNQSAAYDPELAAIVAQRISPYQKVDDYYAQQEFHELTFLMAQRTPSSWEARQSQFEGNYGLHRPEGVEHKKLQRGDALYETPCAALQYQLELESGESTSLRFAFGAAQNRQQVLQWRSDMFNDTASQKELLNQETRKACNVKQATPDPALDNFVNLWLPRQIRYHNELHRLTTDPQTRNFLQDSMGLAFFDQTQTKQNLLLALSQQNCDGSMPDGILLHANAELKYINQIPHADHAAWLVIAMHGYLRESNDLELLSHVVACAKQQKTVFLRIGHALDYLASARDGRGLSFIEQGDWCDPMNMVGHKGKGVSVWLTLATAYAANLWADICYRHHRRTEQKKYLQLAEECNSAVNRHAWDGQWYARGITDDGRTFGIDHDNEGKIFLNPQSWALLANTANKKRKQRLLESVEAHLHSPWGVELFTPPFTRMHEDIGRVTQKFPGSAENGSVYNHAAAFYAYALYQEGEADAAYEVLKRMLPSDDLNDLKQRGQLPNFIPNYYRGAHREHPRTAGRSSQLLHTGTINWYLMCLIDGLYGLKGEFGTLHIKPQLPSAWASASVVREYAGATFNTTIERDQSTKQVSVMVDGSPLSGTSISNIQKGHRYSLEIKIPVNEDN